MIEVLTGLLVTLSDDIRTLSTSHTKLQLPKARAKADQASRLLSRLIILTALRLQDYDFYPYPRSEVISCDSCDEEIEAEAVFYHPPKTHTTGRYYNLCTDCYLSDEDTSVKWIKHNKAPFVTHGFQNYDEYRKLPLKSGAVHIAGAANSKLCDGCYR